MQLSQIFYIKLHRYLSILVVDDDFKYISDDGVFFDTTKRDQDRVIFLTTRSNLAVLENSKVAAADGTFMVKKSYHRQIFTIHGELDDQLLPLVYVYMKRKSKRAYKRIFKILKSYIVSFFLKLVLKYAF